MRLDGSIDENTAHQFELQAEEWRTQIETLTVERNDRLIEARKRAPEMRPTSAICLGHRLRRNLFRR